MLSWELCDDLEEWDWGWSVKAVREGGDICMHAVDSLRWAVEMDRTL